MRSYQFTSVIDAVGRVHHASLNRMCMDSEAARVECCRQCAACGGESAANGVQLVGERHGCLWRNALWMFVAKCAIDVCGEM